MATTPLEHRNDVVLDMPMSHEPAEEVVDSKKTPKHAADEAIEFDSPSTPTDSPSIPNCNADEGDVRGTSEHVYLTSSAPKSLNEVSKKVCPSIINNNLCTSLFSQLSFLLNY